MSLFVCLVIRGEIGKCLFVKRVLDISFVYGKLCFRFWFVSWLKYNK